MGSFPRPGVLAPIDPWLLLRSVGDAATTQAILVLLHLGCAHLAIICSLQSGSHAPTATRSASDCAASTFAILEAAQSESHRLIAVPRTAVVLPLKKSRNAV